MKSIIISALLLAALSFASSVHASPATDIDQVRGIFDADIFPAGEKTVDVSTEDEEGWKVTTLKFTYEGRAYSLSREYIEGNEFLWTEVVFHRITYLVVDEGVDLLSDVPEDSNPPRVDGAADYIQNEFGERIDVSKKLRKELFAQYQDALFALVRHYGTQVSKN